MKKLLIFLSAIFGVFIGFSFATQSISNLSYVVNGDDIKIFWTDNSRGGYMDISLQNPETNDWLHFGEVNMSSEEFSYTKQWNGNQNVRIVPGDGGDQINFTISLDGTADAINNQESESEKDKPTRTVISAVPKTGPGGNLIGIILATLAIFGGYIYIRKRAAI